MFNLFISIIFMLFFLAFLCFSFSVNIKATINKAYGYASRLNKSIEIKATGKWAGWALEYTYKMVEKSNISAYFNYTVGIHLLICLLLFSISFTWILNYLNVILSFAFSLVMFIVPYIFLTIIQEYYVGKERKNAVDFLIIFKNFLISEGDLFGSFKKTVSYLPNPLKSYIKDLTYMHEHKINPLLCLDKFEKKLNMPEMRTLVKNLKICYIQGGDFIALVDSFIEELSNLNEDDDKENTEDKLLFYGLYVLLAINFGVIYWLVKGAYREEIFSTLWGQLVFLLDMCISGYIIYLTLKRT